MATRKAEPLKSAGAQLERDAVTKYLDRQIAKASRVPTPVNEDAVILGKVLGWMKRRRARFDKRVGGLGAK